MSAKTVMFDQVVSRGCGIDVHKENIVATVKGEGIQEECRTFQTMVAKIDKRLQESVGGFAEEMALLQTIPGVGAQAAIAILGEIGTDMSVFPSSKHLASWCGISPGNNESAGKIEAEGRRKVTNF